jgi:predicted small secreted protein
VAFQRVMKMKKTILITNLLIAAFLLSGCATIFTGQYQDVTVTSEPPGATVSAGDGLSITTPGTFKLARNQCYTLTAEFPGAEPQQIELKRKVQGWFWGNILMVSGAGCAIDLTSGSAYKLVPGKVNFDFTNIGIAEVDRNRSYLQTHPNKIGPIRLAGLSDPYLQNVK